MKHLLLILIVMLFASCKTYNVYIVSFPAKKEVRLNYTSPLPSISVKQYNRFDSIFEKASQEALYDTRFELEKALK